MGKPLVYLASPYSHASREVMVERYEAICAVAARLMAKGVYLFSPIAHTHAIAAKGNLPGDFKFWEQYDRTMLAACGELWVCMIDGWRESKGVNAEIKIAEELGLPVRYIAP